MQRIGPTRLLFIHSGRFDYADVELFDSIQLVGANNVGKTSIVAALQFLFVDEQHQMHFKTSLEETRRYYFPTDYSWILFECMTSGGSRVIGARGLGALRQYQFERLTYQGKLDPEDFLRDRRLARPPADVMNRLVDRDVMVLQPNQFRSALTGLHETREVAFGLVPLRQRSDFDQFRQIFRNLLRLARIRQQELKHLLVDVYQLKKTDLNLVSQFQDSYETIQRQNDAVTSLKNCEHQARAALDAEGSIVHLRKALPRAWAMIERGHALESSDITQLFKEYDDREARLTAEEAEFQSRLVGIEFNRDHIIGMVALAKDRLDRLERDRAHFRDFDEAATRAQFSEVRSQIDELTFRIEGSKRLDVERLQTEMRTLTSRAEQLRTSCDRIDDLVAVRLRTVLDDEVISRAFTLLDRSLLDLPITKGKDVPAQVAVYDIDRIIGVLNIISDRIADGTYRDDAVSIGLHGLSPPDLQRYDIERLRTELVVVEAQLKQLRENLADAERIATLREEREARQQTHDALNKILQRYDEWKRELLEEGALRSKTEIMEGYVEELSREDGVARSRLQKIGKEREDVAKLRQEKKDKLEQLTTAIRALPPPETILSSEERASLPVVSGAALERIITSYKNDTDAIQEARRRRQDALAVVEKATYGAYSAGGIDTLDRLRDALDGLPQQEAAVEQLWSSLMVSIRAALKTLVGAIDTLSTRVIALNRNIARFSISNLKAVKLEVTEQKETLKKLRAVIAGDAEPLFARPEEAKQALEEIKTLLKQYPRLEVVDLFGLRFRIEGADGQEQTYDELDEIESNGTTVTIKVVVNLMLLNSVLLPNSHTRIPFYLDEVDSLDDANLTAVLDLARQLGFLAVLASPKPRDNVDAVYFLNDVNGRVRLTPEFARVRLHSRAPDSSGGSPNAMG